MICKPTYSLSWKAFRKKAIFSPFDLASLKACSVTHTSARGEHVVVRKSGLVSMTLSNFRNQVSTAFTQPAWSLRVGWLRDAV